MARTVRASRPFKLDGARNVRDLGGYPTKYGINTATGQFLRADNPSKFTEGDLNRMYDYGVRMQIDFRSNDEIAKGVSKLHGFKDIDFHQVSLMDNIQSADGKPITITSLADLYIGFLDNCQAKYLAPLKNIIEQHMDDAVFFNCTAGKDRTGTFAMIILKLAGCSDEVICADYEVTGDNIWPDMKVMVEQYRKAGHDLDEDLVKSRRVHMERTLAHLKGTYGTIEDWLLKVGLTMDEICTLRNKILGQY